jgi:hypothetical protein
LTLGIRVVGSDNRVLRNVTTEGGGGMGVSGDRNLVGDNVIASQTEDDWFFVSGASDVIVRNDVRLVGGTVCRAFRFRLDQSLIARNTVTGTKTGVTEGECFGFLGTGEGTRLERNIVTGMSTGMDVVGNLQLVRNTASRNSWDGISAGTGVTVTRNTANDNGNLGIDASGAIDGGGNRARGNGNPAQCVGVRCK